MDSSHNLKISNADNCELLDYPTIMKNLGPSTTLIEVRSFLQKDHGLTDFFFLDSEGFAISVSDEKGSFTSELKSVKIAAKKKKADESEAKVDKPNIEYTKEKKSTDNLNYEHQVAEKLASLNVAQGKVENDYFTIKDLTSTQLEDVLNGINYLNGFRLGPSGVLASEKHPFVQVKISPDFQKYVVKDEKSLRDIKKETSASKISLMKFGRLEVTAGLSSPFAGLSGYYSEETTNQTETSSSTSFLFDFYDVRKGFLDLNNYRVLNSDFTNFFKNESDINLPNLNKFIQMYGAYVVNTVYIGGKLFTVEAASSDSSVTDNQRGTAMGAGGKAPIGNSGATGEGGVDKQNKDRNRSELAGTKQSYRKENKGGDPLKVGDEDDWRSSLTNYKTWDVIEIVDMVRTIDLLPKNILELLNKKLKTDTRRNLTIDQVLPEGLKEGDYFNIRNKSGPLYARLSDDNTRLYQDYCGISEDNHWKLKKHSDGSFSIQSKVKDLTLQVEGGQKGAKVIAATYDGSDKQKWYFQKFQDSNFFMIVNKLSQYPIDRYHESQVGWSYGTWELDDNNSYLAFRFETCFDLFKSLDFNSRDNWVWFRLRSRRSNMFLRGGGNLDQSWETSDKSKWAYIGGLLVCKSNNKVIDNLASSNLFSRSWDNGNAISVWDVNHGDNQKWSIVPSNERGWYRIQNSYAKKSLDQKGSTNEGTTPHIWDNDGGNWNQQFRLEKCD